MVTVLSLRTVALPKPNGGSVQAVFAWDTLQDALELVTDVPTFLSAAWQSEPHDKQPVLVVRSSPHHFLFLRRINVLCVEGVFGMNAWLVIRASYSVKAL